MAKEPSFDVVSEVDMQEVNNAINQTTKEITQRFDFKGTKSVVEVENGNSIKIVTEDDTRMRNIVDILQSKLNPAHGTGRFSDRRAGAIGRLPKNPRLFHHGAGKKTMRWS